MNNAVKYVPYQAIVATNNKFDWNDVSFKIIDGKLPTGVTFDEKTGEIYGVPQETGKYKITVQADYSRDLFHSSTADFTLTVLENTDENVDAQTDEGYEIITRVPEVVESDDEDLFFEFEYDYSEHKEEFQGFWIDGVKLTEGTDYTVEPGSTKITIKSQTISSQSNGQHTIAGEYRKTSTNEVKKSGSKLYKDNT